MSLLGSSRTSFSIRTNLLTIVVALIALPCIAQPDPPLSGSRNMTGTITQVDRVVRDTDGTLMSDLVSPYDPFTISIDFDFSELPVGNVLDTTGTPITGGTITRYILDPAEIDVQVNIGPLSTAAGASVQLVVFDDIATTTAPEPIDIWRISVGDQCSAGFDSLAVSFGFVDATATVFDSGDFVIPEDLSPFTNSQLVMLFALVDNAGNCLPAVSSGWTTGWIDGVSYLNPIEVTSNEAVEIGGAGELWTSSGAIAAQALSRARGETSHNLDGDDVSVVDGNVLNCVISMPSCTAGPGVASLTTTPSVGGVDIVHVANAGDDMVTIDSEVIGTGAIVNNGAGPADVTSRMMAEDWSVIYLGAGAIALTLTVDVDMTYSVATRVANYSTIAGGAGSSISAMGSIGLYDTSTLVPDTDTAMIERSFEVAAAAMTSSAFMPRQLTETVTVTLSPFKPYWLRLMGENSVNFAALPPGATSFAGLELLASTFIDPHFEINAEWAEQHPDVAGSIVIEQISSTELLDVAILPWINGPNQVNVRSNGGLTSVTILGNEAFPAQMIDPASLRLGPAGAEPKWRPRPYLADIDRDGDLDLVAKFVIGETGLTCDDESVTLLAETRSGLPVAGSDAIRPVPCGP